MATTVVSMSDQTISTSLMANSTSGTFTWSDPNIGNENKIASIIITGYCVVGTEDISVVTINNISIPFTLKDDTNSEPIEFSVELDPTSATSTTYKVNHTFLTSRNVFFTNLKITVEYYSSTTQFTVRFLNYTGDIINTQQVAIGNAAVAPTAPIATGYTFLGWEQDYSYIGRDMDIAPLYIISLINNIKINNALFKGVFHNEDEIIRIYCNNEIFYNKECSYTTNYDNSSIRNTGVGTGGITLSVETPSAMNNYINNLADIRVRFHLAVKSAPDISAYDSVVNVILSLNGNLVESFNFSKDNTADFEHDKILYENDYDITLGTAIPENIKFSTKGGVITNNTLLIIDKIQLIFLFNL